MKDKQYSEIIGFLRDNTPLMYDMECDDLRYDERSMYYKIYKYIYELKEENKKLKEKRR